MPAPKVTFVGRKQENTGAPKVTFVGRKQENTGAPKVTFVGRKQESAGESTTVPQHGKPVDTSPEQKSQTFGNLTENVTRQLRQLAQERVEQTQTQKPPVVPGGYASYLEEQNFVPTDPDQAKGMLKVAQRDLERAGGEREKVEATAPKLPKNATMMDPRSVSPKAWGEYISQTQEYEAQRRKADQAVEAAKRRKGDLDEVYGDLLKKQRQEDMKAELRPGPSEVSRDQQIRDNFAAQDREKGWGYTGGDTEARTREINSDMARTKSEMDRVKAELDREMPAYRQMLREGREDEALTQRMEGLSRRYQDLTLLWNTLGQEEYDQRNVQAFGRMGKNPEAAIGYGNALAVQTDMEDLDRVLLLVRDSSLVPAEEFEAILQRKEELQKKYGISEQAFTDFVTGDPAAIIAVQERMEQELDQAAGTMGQGYNFKDMYGYTQRVENQQKAAERAKAQKQFAIEHPFLATIGSTAAAPFQFIDVANIDWGHGKPGDPDYVPPDTSRMVVSGMVNTLRGTVSREIEVKTDWELLGQNVWSFLYQTGMSTVDSAVMVATLGPGTTYLMGANAAVNGAKDIIDRGGTAEQAFWGGLAAGAAEVVFEKVSIDNLLTPRDINSWRDFVRETLKQGGIEASEEMCTELANHFSDAAIMGANSNFAQAVESYRQEGMSKEEASQKAYLDLLAQVGWAGAGGAISGNLMGGTVNATNYLAQSQAGGYRLNRPQNVDMPTVPIINLSVQDIPTQGGELPTVGNSLRSAAIQRARARLGLDKNSAVYIPASNVMRDGNEYVLKITPTTLKKMLSPSDGGAVPVESIAVLDNIERIANNGVWFESEGDREGRPQIAGYDYLKTTVYIDGAPHEVKMRVRLVETAPGKGADNVLYYFTPEAVLTVEKVGAEPPTAGLHETQRGSGETPTSNPSIPQSGQEVKRAHEAVTLAGLPLVDKMGENGRTGLAQVLDTRQQLGTLGDMTRADLAEGYAELYLAGLNGTKLEPGGVPLMAGPMAEKLSPTERMQAYHNGVNDAKARVEANQRRAKFATVAGKEKGLVYDTYVEQYLDPEVGDLINETARRLNVRVAFVDHIGVGEASANGQLVEADIRIAKDADNPALVVFGHEVGHWLEKTAPEAYQTLRQFTAQHRKAEIDGVMELYRQAGMEKSYDEALMELVNDDIGRLIGDSQALQNFINEHRSDRTLLQKLADAFRALWQKLTGKERQQVKTAEEALLAALKESETQTAKLEQAGQVQDFSRETEGAEYSIRFDDKGAIAVLEGKYDSDRKAVYAYLQGLVSDDSFSTVLGDAQEVYIGKDLPGEYTQSESTKELFNRLKKDKFRAAHILGDMLLIGENAKWAEDADGKHGKAAKNGWYYYTTRFAVPVYNQDRSVREYIRYGAQLVVRNDADGKSYLYDVTNIQRESSGIAADGFAEPTIVTRAPSDRTTVPQSGDGVKGEYSIKRTSKMTLQEQLKEFDQGTMRSSDSFYLGETPSSMVELGFELLPIAMTQSDFRKSTQKKHDVPRRVIKRLAQGIASPILTFYDGDTAAFVIDETDRYGKPVVVAMKKGVVMDRVPLNGVTSVFGLDHQEVWYKNQLSEGKTLKVFQKEKADALFQTDGSKRLGGNEYLPTGDSVAQAEGDVNGDFSLKGATVLSEETAKLEDQARRENWSQEQMQDEIRAAVQRVYAGRSLTADGELYSYDFLTALPDMKTTTLPQVETVHTPDGKVDTRRVVDLGMKNARAVGTERDGKLFIQNLYTGRELRLDASSIRHGLNGNLNRLLTNARLGAVIGEVVQNAVPINALHDQAEGVTGTYAMAGYATDDKGREFVAIVTVEQRSETVNGIEVYDVAHAVSGRQKKGSQASTKLQGVYPIKATNISIADLLSVVNSTHQSVLSEDVLARLGETRDPEGQYTGRVKYSLKGATVLSEETAKLEDQARRENWSQEQMQDEIRAAVGRVLQDLAEEYGTIRPGERPAREVAVPRRTAEDERVSQTVRTILEAEATPEVAIPNIEELVATGKFSYQQLSDKEALDRAEKSIIRKGWGTSQGDWTNAVRRGEVNKDLTVKGWVLYNHAVNTGDIPTAMEILQYMVGHQRNAAQAVQASRILKQLAPETQLYGVQRSVDSLQEELNQRFGDEKAPKLVISQELAERLLKAADQAERDEVLKDIYRDIGRQMPSTYLDKWNAWRYLAMLGNPRTHVRNTVGNAGFAPVVLAKDMTATAIEKAVYAVSGGKLERSKAFVGLGKQGRGLLAATWGDYAQVKEAALGGGKYGEFQNANKYIEEGRRVFTSKPGQVLEAARKANATALDAEDAWFSQPHYAYAMAQYCAAHGITEDAVRAGDGVALGKAREYAIREAQKATYRDTNALSQLLGGMGRDWRRSKNTLARGAGLLVEGVLPFRKTPANILARGLEYSPLGLVKSLSWDLAQVRRGDMTGAEAIDHISAGLTGTGLLALGVYLAAQGLLRGKGPGDDKERELEKLQGHQDYSLELGDVSVTLDWLAPEALPLFIGANLWETLQRDGDVTMSGALGAVSQVSDPLLEMSCLQSLNDIFDSVGYASQNDLNPLTQVLVSAATSYLTQGLPTVFGQAERVAETRRESTFTTKDAFLTGDMQYFLGKVSGKVPGWEFQQVPYIDAWGRQEGTGSLGQRAFHNFLDPAYVSQIETSPLEEELVRLYRETGDGGVFPSRAKKYVQVNGARKDLTAEEYVDYAVRQGQTARKVAEALVERKQYRNLEDGEKAGAVADAYQYAEQVARQAVAKDYTPDSWVAKAQTAERTYKVPVEVYILLRNQCAGMESIKDRDGKSIDNSKGLQIMEAVYDNTPGMGDRQRGYLFEALGAGKSIRHYNKAKVKEELGKMKKDAK